MIEKRINIMIFCVLIYAFFMEICSSETIIPTQLLKTQIYIMDQYDDYNAGHKKNIFSALETLRKGGKD